MESDTSYATRRSRLVRSTDPGSSAVAVGGIVGTGEVDGAGWLGRGVGSVVAAGVGEGEGVAGARGEGLAGMARDDPGDALGRPAVFGLGLAVGPTRMLDATASASRAETIAPPIRSAATRLVPVISARS
jgi:hypothetical protein